MTKCVPIKIGLSKKYRWYQHRCKICKRVFPPSPTPPIVECDSSYSHIKQKSKCIHIGFVVRELAEGTLSCKSSVIRLYKCEKFKELVSEKTIKNNEARETLLGLEDEYNGRTCQGCLYSINNNTESYKNGYSLVRKNRVLGKSIHRSGWPYAYRGLKKYNNHNGILLDDFVEQTFAYQRKNTSIYDQPWVGIFHHPPKVPSYARGQSFKRILENGRFKKSVSNLKLAITLSNHLRDELREHLKCSVITLKLPAEIPEDKWSFEKWDNNRCLVQVGWFLRNVRAIYQIPIIDNVSKIRLLPLKNQNKNFIRNWDNLIIENSNNDELDNDVVTKGRINNQEYDRLMSSSVVFMDMLAASASTAITDCIARNTPVVINRHPAVIEYLGEDYPLYFDNLGEVPSLILDDKIMSAHTYLKDLDKDWLSCDYFGKNLKETVKKYAY